MSFFTFKDDTTQKFADQKGVREFEAALLAALEKGPNLGWLTKARLTALELSSGEIFERKEIAAGKIEERIRRAAQEIFRFSSNRVKPKRPH